MKKGFSYIYISLFCLLALLPISVPAADLPTLPAAKNIKSGSLPNGIHYYIVRNPSYKGLADIALVQKTGTDSESEALKGKSVVHVRGALTDLAHFSGKSPFSYLKGKSILPNDWGYAKVGRNSTVYRFENLVQARRSDIVDSTLLLVFDIASRMERKMQDAYSPDQQAVIVSGDVDIESIRGKMDILSMFIAKRESSAKEKAYGFVPSDKGLVSQVHSQGKSSVSAIYRSPRTDAEEMSSILPLVSSRYASILEILLRKRLSLALGKAGIPYSSIDFSYTGSAQTDGDEIFRFSVNTGDEWLDAVGKILSETLSNLDSQGISAAEFTAVENELMLSYIEDYGGAIIENAHYIDRCISAFLYGSSLASDEDNLKFFTERNMDGESSARLFNNFLSALLDKENNLELVYGSPSEDLDCKALKRSWDSSWDSNAQETYHRSIADSSALRANPTKIKMRQISSEPLFGGEMWTFANGIRVIYKRVGENGFFNYSWLVKVGFSYMQNLKAGESAYLGELLSSYKIAGLSGYEFNDMLNSNGVTLKTEVSLSEVNISGMAKASKAQLLMKALLSIAGNRSKDPVAYDYFRKCQSLKVRAENSVTARLDSIMNTNLSQHKREIPLADDFQNRADKFYDGIFSRMSDGVLIIVGDIEAEALKKVLLQYMGSFKTEKAYAYRLWDRQGTLLSRKTVYRRGESPRVGMELSSPINFTAENFMAANIAALTVQNAVAASMASVGWTFKGNSDVRMFPEESLVLDMEMSKACLDGLPASMLREDSSEVVLDLALNTLDKVSRTGLTENELKVGKAMLQNYFASWMNDPKSIIRMLVLRYSYGKDLVTGYPAKIAAVSEKTVNPILESLARGGIAMYAERGKAVPEFTEDTIPDTNLPEVPLMVPVTGTLYYPYDGSTVPLDTLKLEDLEFLPVIYYENGDSLETGGLTDSLDVDFEPRVESGDMERRIVLQENSDSLSTNENRSGELYKEKEEFEEMPNEE